MHVGPTKIEAADKNQTLFILLSFENVLRAIKQVNVS